MLGVGDLHTELVGINDDWVPAGAMRRDRESEAVNFLPRLSGTCRSCTIARRSQFCEAIEGDAARG